MAPEAGLRFAGFRDTLPVALDLTPGLPDSCGRDELGLEVGLVPGVFKTGILPAGVFAAGVLAAEGLSADVLAAGVRDAASPVVGRLRSPRVCPVR